MAQIGSREANGVQLMDTTSHIKGQLFGYKELPAESGLWGILLPRPGDKVVAHEPDAQDVVQRLDDSCLVFDHSSVVGNRGFLFALFVPFSLLPMHLVPLLFRLSAKPMSFILFSYFVVIGLIAISLLTVYRAARDPLRPPVYLCRKSREIYAWHVRAKKWIVLDYDRVVPATVVIKAVTPAGSSTGYALTFNQLQLGSRAIEYSVMPVSARGHPRYCGEMWEYVRRYMDGPPEALPPIRLVPTLRDQPNAWMARTDRALFTDFVDESHRVKRELFAIVVVWFWGSLGYWWERAAGWIERTAPKMPLPEELQRCVSSASSADYRMIEASESEKMAQAGTLPHMRRRWAVCGLIGTMVWGGLFALVMAGFWLMW